MKADAEVPLVLTSPAGEPIMITHALQEASSSREVYLVLAAYLEAVRSGAELIDPFREIATAPPVSKEDVKERTFQLFFMLQAVSKSLDDNSRVAVKEALYVFGAVLDRLNWLEGCPPQNRIHRQWAPAKSRDATRPAPIARTVSRAPG